MSDRAATIVIEGVCAYCPTQHRRHGLPCGLCPVCDTFWVVQPYGTGYGIVPISAEDYRAWAKANGYGTGSVNALQFAPNVVTRFAR